MQPAALDQIGVVPIGRARAPWSFPLDNAEDKASGNTASISLHAPMGFVAPDAGGTHGMVAYIFWGGYNVTTSPLRLLDSLLGDVGRS